MSSPPDADVLFNTGREFYAKKAYKEALKAWRAALKQYQSLGLKREVGITSAKIGQALTVLGQKKEALVSCTQAVRILREVKDHVVLREALMAMATVMNDLGYFEEATRALNQAIELQIPREEKIQRVTLLLNLIRNLVKTGRYKESLVRIIEAVEISQQLEDMEVRGEILATYARILQYLENHDEAEKVLTRLIQIWDTTGKSELGAHAQLGLASTLLAKGYLNKAEETIKLAQTVFSEKKDKSGLALSEYHLARLLLRKGQLEAALPHSESALQFFQSQQNQLAYAESALVVAQILGQLVQDVRALRLFDKAIEIFVKEGEQARRLQTHVLKGQALLRIGKQKQAEQEFTQAIRYYQEHKRPDQEARVYLEVGETSYELARFSEALEQTKLAINQLQTLQEEELEIRSYRLLINSAKNAQRFEEELPRLLQAEKDAITQEKGLLASFLSVSLAQLRAKDQSPEQIKGVLEKAIHDAHLPIELRAEAALNLGVAFMKNSQYSEAAQYLSQAIKDFGSEPSFNRSTAYYQLAEAYRHIDKPNLRKEALLGALEALEPQSDEKLQGKLFFELAPLIEVEDTSKALEYYEKAANIFSEGEYPEEHFQTLLKLARFRAETSDFASTSKLLDQALSVGLELDIPIDFTPDKLPLPWKHMQQTTEEAIDIGAHKYHKQKERAIIDKIIDWSGSRKLAHLHPFLADNLGFERCAELAKLDQEEKSYIALASDLRRALTQLSPKGIPKDEYEKQYNGLRTNLKEIMEKINVNRNVIAAACQDPGRQMMPKDYKMLQKLTALMPADRRWIIINYDVLTEKQRIIITTLDHVGRHNIHTLPMSTDLASVIETLQAITSAKELPRMADLKDMASFLYRSLIPSRLERDLQSSTYGFLQFITDGFLNNVPFELIYDGKEYWGLKYPMAWAPDFQFFESTLKTKALAQTSPSSVMVGVNFDPDSQATRKSQGEEIAKAILGAVPTRQGITEPIVLFGRDFTRALLSSNLDQPRSLLFFSTPTSLHYRKGEITLQHPDSLRVIEIGVTLSFKGAPILVLSESSRTEPREDGSSLAAFLRHLIAAGSPSIVFSRWRPDAQLQPVFAQALLKQLYEGDPIAVALFHTRRKLASRGPSPHSWLSYSLCGNPFPTLL